MVNLDPQLNVKYYIIYTLALNLKLNLRVKTYICSDFKVNVT